MEGGPSRDLWVPESSAWWEPSGESLRELTVNLIRAGGARVRSEISYSIRGE